MLDPQQPRGFAHPLANLVAGDTLAFQGEPDVLRDVHVRVKGEELEDEGNVPFCCPVECHVLAIEQDASLGRQLEAGDHSQGRRLAAARRSQHDEKGAVFDCEVRILDGREILEGLAQFFDTDLCHGIYLGKWLTTTKPSVPTKIVTKE